MRSTPSCVKFYNILSTFFFFYSQASFLPFPIFCKWQKQVGRNTSKAAPLRIQNIHRLFVTSTIRWDFLYRSLLSVRRCDLTSHTKINSVGHAERILSTAPRCGMSVLP